MLEGWQAWMQKGGEDLSVTAVLGRQGGARAAQLLAAEYMGLDAQDVDADCCSGD